MAKNIRQVRKALLDVVSRSVKEGVGFRDLRKRANRAMKGYEPKSVARSELLAEAEKKFGWTKDNAADADRRKRAFDLLEKEEPKLAAIGKSLPKEVASTLKSGMRKELSPEKLERNIKKRLSKHEHYARTIVRTTKKQFDRLNTIMDAQEAGITEFMLTGHSSQRKYYKKYGEKPMTLEEIRRTKNDSGLNPVWSGCGYNCGHDWEDVIPDKNAAEKLNLVEKGYRKFEDGSKGGYMAQHKSLINIAAQRTTVKAQRNEMVGAGRKMLSAKPDARLLMNYKKGSALFFNGKRVQLINMLRLDVKITGEVVVIRIAKKPASADASFVKNLVKKHSDKEFYRLNEYLKEPTLERI